MCSLWTAKLMYFLTCFSAAAINNYIAVYYETIGFTLSEISILQTLPPVCFILGSPLWGAIADISQEQRKTHYFTIISGSFLMYSLNYINSFYLMAIIMFFASLQSAPTNSLLDQVVMGLLEKLPNAEYGKQRLFGGIGYGLGAYLTGYLISMFEIHWMFRIQLVSALLSVLVLCFMPQVKIKSERMSFTQGMRQLMMKYDVLSLLVIIFFIGIMYGVIGSFLPLYLYDLSNGDATLVGISVFVATASEVPIFFYADYIIEKVGTTWVLLLSIIGYCIRLTYYSIVVNPWTVLPFECLHGITFSLAWTSCAKYIYANATPGTEGTMMGLFTAMLNGFGKGAGTLVFGRIGSIYGSVVMWQFTLVIGGICSLCALCCFERYRRLALSEEANPLLSH